METVYLDFNATTPLEPAVFDTTVRALQDLWANPSSSYDTGVKSREAVNLARTQVAKMISGSPTDIIFTSGGTESNNLVFHSVVEHCKEVYGAHFIPHVVTTSIEHDSVAKVVQALTKKGIIELSTIAPENTSGAVSVEAVLNSVKCNTVLISVMLANNETGILQPVAEIGNAVLSLQKERKSLHNPRIFIHTDAAQALGKVAVNVDHLKVDYLTIVGHKFYGPRVGALWVRSLVQRSTPLHPMLLGGGQEGGLRSGTENTPMIVGLGKAAELVAENVEYYCIQMGKVRDYLEERLKEEFGKQVHLNSDYKESKRIPNTCNFSIIGEEFSGNKVVRFLKKCKVSCGAACHSDIQSRPSSVLLEVGIPPSIAVNAIRISVGRETTTADIDTFLHDLLSAVSVLKKH